MRARKIRLLAAFAVVALSALLPGPVTAGGGTTGGTSARSLLLKFFDEPAPTPEATPQAVAAPSRPDPATPEPTAEPEQDVVSVPDVEEVANPANLVRDWHVMHVDATTVPAEEPAPPPTEPCPKASTCTMHQVRPARWKTDDTGKATIKWRFNDEGRRNLRAPTGLLESAVRYGMGEWSRWNSNVSFVYDGTTTAAFGADGADGTCSDGVNTVTWHRFDPSVIAAVVTCHDPTGKQIRDTDLALNVTHHWEDIGGEPDSRHSFDIRSIVTHEIGHWLSLLDLYDGQSARQTMAGSSEYGETRKRTLALGDVMGLQAAYPCADGDSCPRAGIPND